jgi:hypothetical protein
VSDHHLRSTRTVTGYHLQATDGEVGMGMIMPDRMHATCAWKGRTSGSCDLYIQSDSTGRALKMLSPGGSGMIRMQGR